MKRAFVDTSAWFAFLRADDPDHAPCAQALKRFRGRLITSSYVFNELVTLCLYRLGRPIALRAGMALRQGGFVDLVPLTPEDEADAWALFQERADKTYSFTDCTSFALMRRLRIPLAIACDDDFRQEGFETLP